jgi:hypothetical protein
MISSDIASEVPPAVPASQQIKRPFSLLRLSISDFVPKTH